jgi:hypothetical protein
MDEGLKYRWLAAPDSIDDEGITRSIHPAAGVLFGDWRRTLGEHVLPKDSDRNTQGDAALLAAIGGLRLIALDALALPQRRRTPRRRDVGAFLVERRRCDRRQAKPGIDGLLRTVLSDDWQQ